MNTVPQAGTELIRTLHDEHAGALYAYAVRLTGDHARAEDVVQETLLRAWRNPRALDGSSGSPRAWLFTVAKRIVIDEWRTRKIRPEISTPMPPDAEVADGTDRAVQSWLVAEALARLSEAHRQVLVACYYRGEPVAVAATRLDIPEGTVKSRLHYGLRALRLELEEMGVSE